ncbi:MAG: DUF805 domain-containing protein [Verrucomicrobiota bacterium]
MNWPIEFIFPHRLHRFAYFLRVVAINVTLAFLYANNWLINPALCLVLLILLVIYAIFFIVLPRLRDIGMSWWWCLFCLIPGVNIVLGIILLLRASKYPFGAPAGVESKI